MKLLKYIIAAFLLLLPSLALANPGMMMLAGIGSPVGGDGDEWNPGFDSDSNLYGWWRFEPGALPTDSTGKGNTLTEAVPVTANTTDFMEGLSSVEIDRDSPTWLYRLDADLSPGFPLKKDDDVIPVFSITGWFRAETVGSLQGLMCKSGTFSAYQFRLYINENNRFTVAIGGEDDIIDVLHTSTAVAEVGKWYHIGFTYDSNDYGWAFIIWSDTDESKIVNASGTHDDVVKMANYPFAIGALDTHSTGSSASSKFDGQVDEATIWDRDLSATEIDSIRSGEYGADPSGGLPVPEYTDNFNRADSNPISGWIKCGNLGELQIISEEVAGNYASTRNIYCYDAAPADDQWAQAKAVVISQGGGPAIRVHLTNRHYYALHVSTTAVGIQRSLDNILETLVEIPGTFAEGDTFAISMSGDVLTAWHNGTALSPTYEDTGTTITGGAFGIRAYHTTSRFDDFEGGDL